MKKILVSACLLGEPCRYDGASKPSNEVLSLAEDAILIPICPEVMGGLSTPRLPCELQKGMAIRSDGEDMTKFYSDGAKEALRVAIENGCDLAILKEKSPSCGSRLIYDGTFQGKLIEGEGITAKLFRKNGIQVFSEEEIKKARF